MQMQPPVLIVAHGQPSDPAQAGLELAGFAAAVAALLPERRVQSATLAEVGRLEAALADLGAGGRIFPMFMAGGWFTRVHLPQRLRAAGAQNWQVLEPFGCDPALVSLAVDMVQESGVREVILAAHGSFKSRVPSDIAYSLAAQIAAQTGTEVRVAFIDQDPQLSSLTGFGQICLPFFAAAGGHVTHDIPAALAKAGFTGQILQPIGLHPKVAELVASAIRAGKPVCATACLHARA